MMGSAPPVSATGSEQEGVLPSEVRHPDGRIEHPSVRYERSDVRFGGVFVLILVVGFIAAFQYWIVWWFFNDYNGYESAIKRSPYPLAPAPSLNLPAEPRLEQLERTAGILGPNVYRREQDKENVFDSSGSTPEKAFVHIPIDRAMKLVVKELPVRSEGQAAANKGDGLLDGGAPNSGRLYRGGTR
jgi:hypothetical protein